MNGKFDFSWVAVFAGALVGIGLSFLFNLFNMAVGLSALRISSEGIATMAIGGFFAMLIGVIIYSYVMGWVAGYLGNTYESRPFYGVLYGFLSWCLALLITISFVWSMSQFVVGYTQALSNPATGIVKILSQQDQNTVKKNVIDTINAKDISVSTSNLNKTNLNLQAISRSLGISLFVTFILFFLGAIASCMGGYYGFSKKGMRI